MLKKESSLLKLTLIPILLIVSFSNIIIHSSTVKAADTGSTTTDTSLVEGVLELAISTATSLTFGSTTLNGQVQTLTASPGTITVKDSTGSGNGWHSTVQASQFTEIIHSTAPAGYTPLTLPLGSLSLSGNGATIIKQDLTNTSPPPAFAGTSWVIDSGSAINFLTANPDEGMGAFDVNFADNSLSLTLDPGKTYISSYYSNANEPTPYSSTITWTIVSGP